MNKASKSNSLQPSHPRAGLFSLTGINSQQKNSQKPKTSPPLNEGRLCTYLGPFFASIHPISEQNWAVCQHLKACSIFFKHSSIVLLHVGPQPHQVTFLQSGGNSRQNRTCRIARFSLFSILMKDLICFGCRLLHLNRP